MQTTFAFHLNLMRLKKEIYCDNGLSNSQRGKEFFADHAVFTILPAEVNQLLKRGFNSVVVDVRETKDFVNGHVPGAINLPKGDWNKISERPNEHTVIVYCYSQKCPLADQAMLEFTMHGYPVIEMEGGFEAWKENKFPVES
jgi:rhodanese-related sulfurtransferase